METINPRLFFYPSADTATIWPNLAMPGGREDLGDRGKTPPACLPLRDHSSSVGPAPGLRRGAEPIFPSPHPTLSGSDGVRAQGDGICPPPSPHSSLVARSIAEIVSDLSTNQALSRSGSSKSRAASFCRVLVPERVHSVRRSESVVRSAHGSPRPTISALHTPPGLPSRLECQGRRLSTG